MRPETLAEMVEDAKLITEQLSGEGHLRYHAENYKGRKRRGPHH